MRRLLSVLSAAALAAAMLVVLPGPAMAQSFFGFDRNNDMFDNNHDFFDNNHGFFDGFGGIDQQTGETGNVDLNSEIVNTGNNSNQCAAPLQFGNTGNLQNAQGFSSFGSPFRNGFDNGFFGFDGNIGDVEFGAPSFEFNPEQNVQCDQAVQQSAAASG